MEKEKETQVSNASNSNSNNNTTLTSKTLALTSKYLQHKTQTTRCMDSNTQNQSNKNQRKTCTDTTKNLAITTNIPLTVIRNNFLQSSKMIFTQSTRRTMVTNKEILRRSHIFMNTRTIIST